MFWRAFIAAMVVLNSNCHWGGEMRTLAIRLGVVLFGVTTLAGGRPAHAVDLRYPIFDTHVHYSEPAWSVYSPAEIIAKFDRAGVVRALVSSSPDDGTLALYKLAPTRVVPELRPYRDGVGSGNWTQDPFTPAYLAGRLAKTPYAGIGEFHLLDVRQVETPVVRKVIEFALERNILLHVHSDAEVINALFAAEPRLNIVWAHAGLGDPPEVIGPTLDAHKNLWADLSIREFDLLRSGGRLDPVWRTLLMRHADRFMVGSDTWITAQWYSYDEIRETNRLWLAQLPENVARAIAYRNAVKLFGTGGHEILSAE